MIACVLMLAWSHLIAADLSSGSPLPSLESVMERAIERSRHENEAQRLFKQQYAYTRMKVTEYRDSGGDLKSREEKTSEKKPRLRIKPKSDPEEKNSKRESVLGKDFSLSHEILDRFDFTLIGRETINNRPALIIDFKPKKKTLPETTLRDRFINHAAGRVWLDENDYALAKAEVYLTQTINVFGGVAGAVWKFTARLDRGRTDDGLWFLRQLTWHVEGREVVIPRFMDYHEFWTNVRKAP